MLRRNAHAHHRTRAAAEAEAEEDKTEMSSNNEWWWVNLFSATGARALAHLHRKNFAKNWEEKIPDRLIQLSLG